jgi:DNA-binding NarL/FixJ family response regulator
MSTAQISVVDNAQGNGTSAQRLTQADAPPAVVAPTAGVEAVVIIDKRELFRECLASSIAKTSGHKVFSSPDVESWLDNSEAVRSYLIIYCCPGEFSASANPSQLARLAQIMKEVPVVVLSDCEDLDPVVDAIARGARGYIPTSLSLAIVSQALRLVEAGGIFMPAGSVMAALQASETQRSTAAGAGGTLLTPRQTAVVAAIGKGKANKIIAHELNMHESTVKVHVRRIMKKLNAKNRTEVALMANELLNGA